MKRTKMFFLFVGLLLMLSVGGCGSQPTPMALGPTATAFAYPPPMYEPDEIAATLTALPDDAAVADEVVSEPAEESQSDSNAAVPAESDVDNCLACHTDQQTLMDTADPVAEVVSENEGEG